MSQATMVRVSVRIPRRFLKEAQKIARHEEVTLSHFIRRTLAREFIAREDLKGA